MTDNQTKSDGAPAFMCNAIIRSADLTIADHGVLSGWVDLNYGGAGQGFGGHVLGGLPEMKRAGKHGDQPNFAAEFIVSVLRCAGVETWKDLPGKTIRVKKKDEWGDIIAIGHIVDDSIWFEPRKTFDAMISAREARP